MRQLLSKLVAILVLVSSFAVGWLLMEYRSFVNAPLRRADGEGTWFPLDLLPVEGYLAASSHDTSGAPGR